MNIKAINFKGELLTCEHVCDEEEEDRVVAVSVKGQIELESALFHHTLALLIFLRAFHLQIL